MVVNVKKQIEEEKKYKIAILTPNNRLCGCYFWMDLIELIIYLLTKRHKILFRQNESSAPLNIKREYLAQEAINQNVDYILWLDDDMRFGPDVFDRLLKWDKDIISGMYADRYGNIICKTEGQKMITSEMVKKEELIEIESTGFGILLVKAEVFRKMKRPWFEWKLGRPEDLDWCLKAREQGFKIYCDPNTFLGHGYTCLHRYHVLTPSIY